MPPKRKLDAFDPAVDTAKEPLSRDNLKAACWCTVAMIAKEEESQGLSIAVSEAFVASLGELVFQQALSLGKDLEAFAAHTNRSTIEADDVKLAVRRNGPLYTALEASARRHGVTFSTSSKSGGALAKKTIKPASGTTSAGTSGTARAQPRVSKAAQAATLARQKALLAGPGTDKQKGSEAKANEKGKGKAVDLELDSNDDGQMSVDSESDQNSAAKKKTKGKAKAKAVEKPKTSKKKKKEPEVVEDSDDDDSDDERNGNKSKGKKEAVSTTSKKAATTTSRKGKGKAKAVVPSDSEDDGEGLGSGFDSDES